MPKPTSLTNALDHLQHQWRDCYEQQIALQRELTELRAEVAEADRKRQIAVRNAYEEGFNAGREEAQPHRRHVVRHKVSK